VPSFPCPRACETQSNSAGVERKQTSNVGSTCVALGSRAFGGCVLQSCLCSKDTSIHAHTRVSDGGLVIENEGTFCGQKVPPSLYYIPCVHSIMSLLSSVSIFVSWYRNSGMALLGIMPGIGTAPLIVCRFGTWADGSIRGGAAPPPFIIIDPAPVVPEMGCVPAGDITLLLLVLLR
jgi:hypothetical protein